MELPASAAAPPGGIGTAISRRKWRRFSPPLMYSLGPLGSGYPFPALPGLPGSSTDLSLRAVPNHPGRSDRCLLIASPPVTGSIIFGRLATSSSVTRPNRVHLRYGSRVRLPTRPPHHWNSRSLGYMLNRQFTW